MSYYAREMSIKTNNTLSFFGIYPHSIEKAYDVVVAAMTKMGYENEIDNLFDDVERSFIDNIDEKIDISNTLIFTLFDTALRFLEFMSPNHHYDYYVNGYDSHFYIDHEEVFA